MTGSWCSFTSWGDLIDLHGAGLAALLLLDGGQQGQAQCLGKVAEAVVEGDEGRAFCPLQGLGAVAGKAGSWPAASSPLRA